LDFIIFVAFIIKFIFYLFLIFYFLTLFFPNLGLQVNFTNLKTLLKLWNLMSESIVFKTILKYNLNTLWYQVVTFDIGFLFLIKINWIFLLMLLNIFLIITDSWNIRQYKILYVTNPSLKCGSRYTQIFKRISKITVGVLVVVACIFLGFKLSQSKWISELTKELALFNIFQSKIYKETELYSVLGNITENDHTKSSVLLFYFNLDKIWDWYEGFDGLTTTVCIFIFNSYFIAACILTIVLNLYGDYLLDRFKLSVRYPRLAQVIKYRKKIGKYYIISNIVYIIIACILNIFFW